MLESDMERVLGQDQKVYWRDVAADVKHGYLSYATLDEAKCHDIFYDLMRICEPTAHFLEIGFNSGTNFEYLRRNGFKNFTGLEINPRAVEHFEEIYPEAHALTSAHVGDALPIMRGFADNSFDVVFTKGCLVVIPYEDDEIFFQMARTTRNVIMIREPDPINGQGVHFPRDFEKIFSDLGFHLILKKQSYSGKWGNLDPARRNNNWLRIFARNTVNIKR